jgi:hypothetical protein
MNMERLGQEIKRNQLYKTDTPYTTKEWYDVKSEIHFVSVSPA